MQIPCFFFLVHMILLSCASSRPGPGLPSLVVGAEGDCERMFRQIWGHSHRGTQTAETKGGSNDITGVKFKGKNRCLMPKCHFFQGAMERVEEGEVRLTQVCEEGEKLLLHLPKASAGQVQQHLSSIQQEWDSFVEQCRQNQQILEDSASLMKG